VIGLVDINKAVTAAGANQSGRGGFFIRRIDMAIIHEKFEMLGVHYVVIHFKVSPFAKDLIVRYFENGIEISRSEYEEAKAEDRKLWKAAYEQRGA
jgi:hypothetical protein